jgi:hypothetical protein
LFLRAVAKITMQPVEICCYHAINTIKYQENTDIGLSCIFQLNKTYTAKRKFDGEPASPMVSFLVTSIKSWKLQVHHSLGKILNAYNSSSTFFVVVAFMVVRF